MNETIELNVRTEIWQYREFAILQMRQASLPSLAGYQAILWHQVTRDVLAQIEANFPELQKIYDDSKIEILFEIMLFDAATDKKMPNEAFTFLQNQCYFKVGCGLEENAESFDFRYNRYYRLTAFLEKESLLRSNY